MILSALDVASASKWSAIWEWCEYASEALVFGGCVCEYIAEYTKWRTEEARHSLGRRSLLVLILGLGFGLFSLIKTNALAGIIIASLGEQVEQAGEKVERVSGSLEMALAKASQAETASSDALSKSTKAQTSASDALTLAGEARQEADTFEKRLGGAEHKADEAEQHLADSLKRANEAGAEADRLKERFSDRVIDPARIARDVGRFSGQLFRITMYGNGEPVRVANQLFSGLISAKWSPQAQEEGRALFPGITGIEVYVHPNADKSTSDAANALVAALISQGLATTRRAENDPNPTTPTRNRIEINVGTKE
jgi:hypothetical protein